MVRKMTRTAVATDNSTSSIAVAPVLIGKLRQTKEYKELCKSGFAVT